MKTWLLLTTVPQVRRKVRPYHNFLYDYNDIILRFEPSFVDYDEQTE